MIKSIYTPSTYLTTYYIGEVSMNILQTIISYLAIAGAFISSIFSWGDSAKVPYTNTYDIPESIPEYSVISTEKKSDWKASWIWDEENLTENNVWMCFSKKVNLD